MQTARKIRTLKVLLIEDNPRDVQLIKDIIADVREVRFELSWANRLAAGLKRLKEEKPDAVLLDLSLPDSHWFETFRTICGRSLNVPILVLTGLNDPRLPADIIQGGAQDYLVKGEIDGRLLAHSILYAIERSRAQGDKRKGAAPSQGSAPRTQGGGFRIDFFQQKVWYRGRPLRRLPAMEFKILACLIRHFPKVVTRRQFSKEVWKQPALLSAHTLQAHLFNLRKHLPSGAGANIVSVPKKGYQLAAGR